MVVLECGDQLRQDEELVATNEKDELGVARISVKIGNVVDIGNGEHDTF